MKLFGILFKAIFYPYKNTKKKILYQANIDWPTKVLTTLTEIREF